MNLLTSKKCELLNDFQKLMVDDALKNKRDYMLIITNDNNTLEICEYCSINDLYDFLTVNYEKINIKALNLINDDYTMDIVNILLDLIKKEMAQDKLYRRVFLDVDEMLKKYYDFTIQYAYENYLTKQYEFYSTRSLNGFYLTVQKDKNFITCANKLLLDAVIYAIDNHLILYEWLGVEIE